MCVFQRWRSASSAWCPRKLLDTLWTTSPPRPGRIKWSLKDFTVQHAKNRDPLFNTIENWVNGNLNLTEYFILCSSFLDCICQMCRYIDIISLSKSLLICGRLINDKSVPAFTINDHNRVQENLNREKFVRIKSYTVLLCSLSQVCCSRGVLCCCRQRTG